MVSESNQGVRLAIEGCGHGTLNEIYASIDKSCEAKGWDGVDALIIGGDFQAVRNTLDLNCMAVPVKYREIGDFHEYYSGTRKAPYLTIFVGGNHEASNHLFELSYGGWVAPNIYYLGAANVLRLGSLRIAGQSGIWKGYNYKKPHFERLPYNQDDVRSIYHVREIDTRKLLQLKTQVDIGLSHDWPRGIEWLGNYSWLFKKKDMFEEEAKAGQLGSVAARKVLDHLRPAYWFAAHLHIKYAAVLDHDKQQQQSTAFSPNNGPSIDQVQAVTPVTSQPAVQTQAMPTRNDEEIDLDMDDDDEAPSPAVEPKDPSIQTQGTNGGIDIASSTVPEDLRAQLPASFAPRPPQAPRQPDPPTDIPNLTTRFLALDKCLPRRDFLQLLEIPTSNTTETRPYALTYDPEWLAITRAFALAHPPVLGDPTASSPPDLGKAAYRPLIEAEEAWVQEHIVVPGRLAVPLNFEPTAPVYDPSLRVAPNEMPDEYTSPQTAAFCQLLGIENAFAMDEDEKLRRKSHGPRPSAQRGGGAFRGGGGRGRGRGGRGFGGRGRGRGRGR